MQFPRHDPVHLQLYDLLGPAWRPYFSWREFLMGIVWVAILLIMKDIGKRHTKCAPRPRPPRPGPPRRRTCAVRRGRRASRRYLGG
jgi:hypothetical protein